MHLYVLQTSDKTERASAMRWLNKNHHAVQIQRYKGWVVVMIILIHHEHGSKNTKRGNNKYKIHLFIWKEHTRIWEITQYLVAFTTVCTREF